MNLVVGYNDGGKWTRPDGLLAASLAPQQAKQDKRTLFKWEEYLVDSEDIFSTEYVRITGS